MRNIVLAVSYDGTSYSGFQTQPSGNTIQDRLEQAIAGLTGETVQVTGSGRTDAGVHARKQVIHFLTESAIPIERWCLAINSRLPNDIVVTQAQEAPLDFHARRWAKRKTYCYTIQRSMFPDVFARSTRFHHPQPLDVNAMRSALGQLEGEHDFRSFCSAKTMVGSHVRTIYETAVDWEPLPVPGDGEAGVIRIFVTGSGFLYNMVRIVVGTLMEIGEGKREASSVRAILAAEDRAKAGPTAMAHGLMLWDVEYENILC